jgi:hypothetical protein
MLLASVIKSASLLLVWRCLLLTTSFFVSDVVAWQAHNLNRVTTAYLLDLSYYHSLVIVVTCFLSASPCSNTVHCSVQLTQLFLGMKTVRNDRWMTPPFSLSHFFHRKWKTISYYQKRKWHRYYDNFEKKYTIKNTSIMMEIYRNDILKNAKYVKP